ncbi:MAG: FAD-dependent thymidylate synthase [Armatimonadota bacterium]
MGSSLSPEERALLAPYVTSLDSPVFVLKNLPEEVVAVLFAYYSRSLHDLRANLLRLLQDQDLAVAPAAAEADDEEALAVARQKAKEFHEKWVVGYGHASVAEHAVAHVAIEEVSIVASKVIEDARLAAYTEKSTRYVPFPRAYYPAPELEGQAASVYRECMEHLFDVYETLLPQVTERVMETADRSEFKTERGFRNSCQAQACDALRYLLPAATHTNIGLTANARTLEHLISKMLSHPLAEVQEAGERIRVEATKVIPTLIKYARRSDYRAETPVAMEALAAELLPPQPRRESQKSVELVQSPTEAEARLAAAILYEFTGESYAEVWERVQALDRAAHERVIEEYLRRRRTYGDAKHGYTDPPLRSLEHLYFTCDILVDYGAFRDIQRHRMATQTTQRLTCEHGYDVPELLERYGFADQFHQAMTSAAEAFEQLAAAHPDEAQYLVPLAYRKRVLFTWNLRELHHFISLRSARQGHPSYRRIAQEVYRELERAHPFLARFIRVDMDEYDMTRPG